MKKNTGRSKVKRSNFRRKRKTPEQRARDRAINQAIAKAGKQNGPFIVRKGAAPIGLQTDSRDKNKREKANEKTPENHAIAEAMERAGIPPKKLTEPAPKREKPTAKDSKPTAKHSTRASQVKEESKSGEKPKLNRRKKKNANIRRAASTPTASAGQGRKSKKRFLAKMRKVAEDMQGDLTPLELRWQERQIEIAKLIDSIESAPFSDLATQWKKHVALTGYIEATGNNADRRHIYAGLIAAIEREWARRSKLVYSSDEYFDWPSTRVGKGKRGATDIDWASEGFLSYLGYHVGESSELTERDRHTILKRVFAMMLPPLESPEYVKSWGAPGSAMRLKKMADSLASFARSAKRRGASNLSTAIAEWEGDLSMLHEEFYVAKFGFGWPAT